MTLSCIVKEYPYKFLDPLFKSRCKCVLENIRYYRKDYENVVDYYLNALKDDKEKKKNLIVQVLFIMSQLSVNDVLLLFKIYLYNIILVR